ncbi:FAD-dependent oxidoreductase [Pseudonocardia sp. GCM10023141]|uniref:FAD-dependent oxidoreductase n=1 Tax=Pseudonocardia sp. GCM10023141 TaxID=3252653 RepID=UPI00360FFAD2
MDRIVVAGGSLAGLVVALFAARSGREVVVLEGDDRPVPAAPEDVWQGWRRRGVPQFRQLHGTQALGWSILAARAPDVLAELGAVGACAAQLLTLPGPVAAELVQLRCRRPILEWVLRRTVLAEPGIEFRPGTEVTGLRLGGRSRPRVSGVITTSGELAAQLVIDATGRRSRIGEWCVHAGASAPQTRTVETGQAYFTRWFRRSTPFTATDPMLRVELAFATLLLCPADADWFSATFFAPVGDRALRRLLMDSDGFRAAVASVPSAAAWLEDARPVGTVQFMGGLANQLRHTAPDGRSPVGLLAVGDSAVCTNPTWGRGGALAMASAAALVDAMTAFDNPSAVTRAHTVWTTQHHEPWFYDTLLLDAETNAAWAGRPPSPHLDRPFRHAAAALVARTDAGVGVAYMRYRNLIDPPEAFWGDTEIADRVLGATNAGATTHLNDAPLPSRQQFLALDHAVV